MTAPAPTLPSITNAPQCNASSTKATRRWPVGAEVVAPGQAHFRVWAPNRRRVEVVLEDATPYELAPEGNGYFAAGLPIAAGVRYLFRLDGGHELIADPASRFQPDGPFGPSEVVDPASYTWSDTAWMGSALQGRVIYEMHVGTFTPEGTWQAALAQLPRLADLGVNLLEVMPVADFPGRFGWGYDGVNLFAPTRLYGRPDDFRAFVDHAHALGIGVLLDVVYNHVGPAGNVMKEFSPAYFSDRHKTDWGQAINFDGPDSGPVREFYLMNAAYWIAEYHLDGLRLDATQNIYDDSNGEHILAAISRATRETAGQRSIVLVAENEPQHTKLVRSAAQGGYGLDMLWNDDFHHSARVALTGRSEAYYSDYRGRPQELISAIKYGYLFQGQHYRWQKKPRGTPALDLPPRVFVTFLDNHDQVANSGAGLRSHVLTSPGRYRALTTMMLLAPATPMLFQGQEFASSAPFYFFADHEGNLATMVREGRIKFLAQFPSLGNPDRCPALPDPRNLETFARCRLDPAESDRNRWAIALHRDLLRLRREDPTFRSQRPRGVDGAVLAREALALRFFGESSDLDRLLLLNLSGDLHCSPLPEPLLAPPAGCNWVVHWSSEDPCYNGGGMAPLTTEVGWHLPGHAALVLFPALAEGDGEF